MLKRYAAVGATVLASSGLAVGVAGAATSHARVKHPFDVTAKVHSVTTDSTGGVLAFKGTVTGTGGKGTVITSDHIMSATKATSTSTTTYKKGSLTLFFNVAEKIGAKSITFTGTGHVVKGTGIYKHASGKNLKLTGSAPSTLKTAKFTVKGTVTY